MIMTEKLSFLGYCVSLKNDGVFQKKLKSISGLVEAYASAESIYEHSQSDKSGDTQFGAVSYLLFCRPENVTKVNDVLGNTRNSWHTPDTVITLKACNNLQNRILNPHFRCLVLKVTYMEFPTLLSQYAESVQKQWIVENRERHKSSIASIDQWLYQVKDIITAYVTTKTDVEDNQNKSDKTEYYYVWVEENNYEALQRQLPCGLEFDPLSRIFDKARDMTWNSKGNVDYTYSSLCEKNYVWHFIGGDALIKYVNPILPVSEAMNPDKKDNEKMPNEVRDIDRKRVTRRHQKRKSMNGRSYFTMSLQKRERRKITNTCQSSPSQKNKDENLYRRILIFGIVALLALAIFFFGKGMTKEKEQVPITPPPIEYTDYRDKLPEMVDSFRKVYAENPNSFILKSVTWEAPDTLVLVVNNNWYIVSNHQKKATIESALKIWTGMAGARDIHINMDNIEVKVTDPNTGEKLAKWGAIRGTQIYESN